MEPVLVSGSGGTSLFRGSTTTTSSTEPEVLDSGNGAFCENCADWLHTEGWQENGTYLCPTCFKISKIDLMWKA